MRRLFLLMIPIFGMWISINGLWAEPEPEEPGAAFHVQIQERRAELTDMEVEVMEMEKDGFDKAFDLFCRCVEAEAGNQSLLGKRLVCDVILNRVSSSEFPNGLEDVINQPGQFAVVANGAIDRVTVTEETRQAVIMEMNERIDTEIIYFRSGSYPSYGVPAYKLDDHYFSK